MIRRRYKYSSGLHKGQVVLMPDGELMEYRGRGWYKELQPTYAKNLFDFDPIGEKMKSTLKEYELDIKEALGSKDPFYRNARKDGLSDEQLYAVMCNTLGDAGCFKSVRWTTKPKLCIWLRPKTEDDHPDIKGRHVIESVRRILKIPQPQTNTRRLKK